MNGDSSGEEKEFHAPFEGQFSPLTRTIAHPIAAARSLSWPEPSGSPDRWFPLAATAIPPLSQRKCLLPSTGPSKGANRSSVVVGIIHGFGAETPSQLLLLLMTAKLGEITVSSGSAPVYCRHGYCEYSVLRCDGADVPEDLEQPQIARRSERHYRRIQFCDWYNNVSGTITLSPSSGP